MTQTMARSRRNKKLLAILHQADQGMRLDLEAAELAIGLDSVVAALAFQMQENTYE